MPQLAELAAWLVEQPVRQVPIVRRWGRLRADLPFRTNSPIRVPARVFRPHWRDLDPYMQVDDIGWEQDRLVVTGRANVPSVDIPRRRNTSKIVVLRPPGRRLPVVLPARSFLHPEATALSEQDRYNYDWSGFRFTVSPRRFRGTGEWQCYMLVRGHGVWRPARVHTPVPGPAERPRPRQVAPGLRFGARWAGLGLNLAVWRLGAVVAALAWQDADSRAVQIDVEVPGGAGSPARPSWYWCAAGVRRPGRAGSWCATAGPPSARSPAEASPAGGPARFRALVPLGDLAGATDAVDRVGRVAGDDGMAWDVYLKRPGRPRVRVAWPDGMPESRHLFGGREAVAGQSRYGDLVIAERTPRPVIDEHEWQPDGRLVLRGSFLGAGLPGAGLVGAGPRRRPVRDGAAPDRVRRLARHRLPGGGRAVQHRDRPGPDAVLRLGHPAAGRRMEPLRPPGGRLRGPRRWPSSSTTATGWAMSPASGSRPGASGTG